MCRAGRSHLRSRACVYGHCAALQSLSKSSQNKCDEAVEKWLARKTVSYRRDHLYPTLLYHALPSLPGYVWVLIWMR